MSRHGCHDPLCDGMSCGSCRRIVLDAKDGEDIAPKLEAAMRAIKLAESVEDVAMAGMSAEIEAMRKVIRLGRTAVRDLQSSTHGQFPFAAEDYMRESEKWK